VKLNARTKKKKEPVSNIMKKYLWAIDAHLDTLSDANLITKKEQ
jgi:hypothetical protein